MDCLANSESEEEESEEEKEAVEEDKKKRQQPFKKWKKKKQTTGRQPLRQQQQQGVTESNGQSTPHPSSPSREKKYAKNDQRKLTSESKEMDYYKPESDRGRLRETEVQPTVANNIRQRYRDTTRGESPRSFSRYEGNDKAKAKENAPAPSQKIHPSWEAKKKLKMSSISLVPSQGKKITFDD